MSRVILRSLVASAFVLCPLALSACPRVAVPTGGEHEPLCGDDFRSTYSSLTLPESRNVEILFVIDNSGSMAEEQVKLVEAADVLFEQLDAANANYRVGFTTTDVGNPQCPDTTPEAGGLVASSCETRLDDFLFDNGSVDARDLACNDLCSLDAAALTIQPSSTDRDTSSKPRPWLERTEGVTNLPATTDPLEAFRCFAPQGIAGCGFEAPLEAMYQAIQRSEDDEDDNYGFMRANSAFAVVTLTDEEDCSNRAEWAEIFSADGNQAFWSDPAAASPSSAVCWNAGVTCTGDPTQYDGCEPAEKNVEGDETTTFVDVVLHPLARYIETLEGIHLQKQEFNIHHELVFTLIAGVEGNGADWSVTYADAIDPEYQLAYGIGPGCTSMAGDTAVPPVRMRAVAEDIEPIGSTGPLGLYSVCESDYTAAMADLAERITAQFHPLCLTRCVADSELSTPQLEPSCVLEQSFPGEDEFEPVLECMRAADGSYLIDPETATYQLPDATDVCYATLVDRDGSETQDPNDDISEACLDFNYNLEFVIVRPRGVAARDGSSISVDCEGSPCPDEDCPGIGQ
jgi:hypothetical protein